MNLFRRGIGSGQWAVGSGQWAVTEINCSLPTAHCPLPLSSSGVENRSHHYFAERDFAVIALDHYRARLAFIAVERAAGDPFNHDVVVYLLAVEDDSQTIAYNRRFHRLPL